MLTLAGPPATSEFRLDELVAALGSRAPAVEGVSARLVHFLQTSRPLTPGERRVLDALLAYGARQRAAVGRVPATPDPGDGLERRLPCSIRPPGRGSERRDSRVCRPSAGH